MKRDNIIDRDMPVLREEIYKNLREQKLDEQEVAYSYWLDAVPGIGRESMCRLRYFVGTPRILYEATDSEREVWLERKWISTAQEKAWQKAKQERDALQMYERLKRQGIYCVPYGSGAYPKRLYEIPDPPINLYVRGMLPDDFLPSVGIVGARLCSDYGRYTARQFGRQLAKAGIQVISGMAMGVDGISQQAALEVGGRSFGVLGCGADICYPEQNQNLYNELVQKGGILSEYIPGTQPKAGLFPARNRIISGCADLVLVIEARKKSGTLITVDAALEQGREVYALPGRVTDALAAGCNELIRQGAGIAVSPEYVAEAAWEIWQSRRQMVGCASRQSKTEQESNVPGEQMRRYAFSEKEQILLAHLSEQGKTAEDLYQELQQTDSSWTIALVSATLMQLCVGRHARMENGRFYGESAQIER